MSLKRICVRKEMLKCPKIPHCPKIPVVTLVLEEDTVWKCVFNLVYVHANSKGKDRGLKNQGYMIT